MPKRYLLLVMAVAGLTFGLSLFNGFVGDDEVMIVRNQFYATLDNLPLLVSDQYIADSRAYFVNARTFNSSGAVSYRPVNSLSYFADRAVWGLNPFGYHLHNWLLHILNTGLVFGLAWLILRQGRVAAWAAVLFGTHPLAAEAVCAISYRHDLQACLFSLTAIISYIRFRSHGRRRWYAVSLTAYALAVFSKESALLLPAVLALYELLYGRSGERTARWQPVGLYGLITVFYLWTYLFLFPNSAIGHNPAPVGGPVGHLGYMMLLLGQYLTAWLLPLTVRPLPGLFDPQHLMAGTVPALSIGLVLAVGMGLFFNRRDRDILFFTGLAVLFYLPASNLLPLANPMAHRFLYLPMVGMSVALMLGLEQLPLKATLLRLLRIGLMAACVLTSLTVSAAWKNNLTLAHSWTKDFPHHAKGHAILGIGYYRRGDCEKAAPPLREALRLGDRDPRLLYILGRCAVPDDARAAAYYLQALQWAPDYAAPYRGLGQIAAYRGRCEQALDYFERSLDNEPSVAAYRFIRQCLEKLGRPEEWERWRTRAASELTAGELTELGPGPEGTTGLPGKILPGKHAVSVGERQDTAN